MTLRRGALFVAAARCGRHLTPPGDFAGAVIERLGLKGLRSGGAVVSELHANFIVNDQRGSAADIAALLARVQVIVAERTSQHLEPEVERIGEWA